MFTFPWKFLTRLERQTDIALQASKQRFRALFETMPDPAWIIGDHRFVEANAAALKAVGYADKPAFLALHRADISPDQQPDGEASFDKAERIFQPMDTIPVQRFDWTHKQRDGHLFPVEVTLSSIEWDGQPVLRQDSPERGAEARETRHARAGCLALAIGLGLAGCADGLTQQLQTDLAGCQAIPRLSRAKPSNGGHLARTHRRHAGRIRRRRSGRANLAEADADARVLREAAEAGTGCLTDACGQGSKWHFPVIY